MGAPKIGRNVPRSSSTPPETPDEIIAKVVAEVSIPPGSAAVGEDDVVRYSDIKELAPDSLTVPPMPPQCILKRLEKENKVWRWLSVPQVHRFGPRNYETVSPTAGEREAINSGRDTPAGVHVDVENKIRWMDDAWLGAIPRRLYIARQVQKKLRTMDQTKLSRDREPLKEAFKRMGGTLRSLTIEDETTEDILRDPESKDF